MYMQQAEKTVAGSSFGVVSGYVCGKIQTDQQRRDPEWLFLSLTIESFFGWVACFDFGERDMANPLFLKKKFDTTDDLISLNLKH